MEPLKLKITYRPEQSAKENSSLSPSAGKPAKLMEKIATSGYSTELLRFEPVTREMLAEAHDPDFVDGVLDGEFPNGFGNQIQSVADTLPYTTGSFVAAALEAFRSKDCVLSPTSGFHHAHYERGGAFCTFNGLIVAAQQLKKAGARKIAIIDLDQHYGDGTAALLTKHGLAAFVAHYTSGADHITKANAETWLQSLPSSVSRFADADVWLVQLGADPYVNDPLGGVLTMEQLYRRDLVIFQAAKNHGIPVAWNLAGGYAELFDEVLQIHMNSIRAYFEANGTSNQELSPARQNRRKEEG